MASQKNTKLSSRTAAWIGGIALLLIAVLAGIGNLGLIAPLIAGDDAATIASNIAGADLQFRVGVLFMIIAAVLDIVVAAALLTLFTPINRMVAIASAWFRVAYAAVFLVAIGHLMAVPGLLGQPDVALRAVDAFNIVWQLGLILFAVHLLLVGYLMFNLGIVAKIVGILVAIAGLGYLADGILSVTVDGYTPTIATFTFIGEVVLIVWLIITAVSRPKRVIETAGRESVTP